MKLLDTFAGIGGFSYAAEKLVGGFETTQFIEINPYCQKILNKHWSYVPIHDDITTFTAKSGEFDIITGGFPCQDISVAGLQKGITKETRSGLFYELIRVIRMVRPKYVVLENVAAILKQGMMQNGQLYQQVLWEPVIDAVDGGWLPTPRASDVEGGTVKDVQYKNGNFFRENKEGVRWGVKLRDAVSILPTPTARDYKDSGENMNYKKAAKKGRLPGVIVESRSTQTGKDTNLNPHFVEEMMGYPIGWTDLKH